MVKSSQFLNKVGVVAMASLVALIFVSVDLSKASTVQSDTDNNKKSVEILETLFNRYSGVARIKTQIRFR